MTGYYPQQIGCDPPRKQHPDWVTYLPQHLKQLGYRTYQSGKWHVPCCPKVLTAGFDRSYEILDHDRHFSPRNHRIDDKPIAPIQLGADYYSTLYIAQTTINQLKSHELETPDEPFFCYTAFIAPHFPLMAPKEDIQKYKTAYLDGWDQMRQRRLEKMTRLGIYSGGLSRREESVGPPYRFPNVLDELGAKEVLFPVDWNALTDEQQAFQAAKMAIHAAMVDRMDQEIGRIVEQVRRMGQLENTVIFFLSDNGASAEIMIRGDRNAPNAIPGSAESFLCLGPGFSCACNTPFRRHKTWVHEGGISTPLIVYGPSVIGKPGAITNQPGHLIDLVPTILDLAGASESAIHGPDANPYPGRSLAQTLRTGAKIERGDLFFNHEGNRALKSGKWKIVLAAKEQKANEPLKWELYDLETDRAEQNNLAEQYPERVNSMAQRWNEMNEQFRFSP